MNWALIGVPAIAIAAACLPWPACALPSLPPSEAAAASAEPVLLVRYRRHNHRWHHRHSAYRHHHRGSPSEAIGGAVKPGRWQFTAELVNSGKGRPPGGTPLPQDLQPGSGGGIKTSYTSCVRSDNAVPAELGPQCRIDSTERDGTAITWSMTCTNAQGTVRSNGVARYAGDTMDATMISRLPGANGAATDMVQHITGRYLGPCAQ